MRQKTVIIKVPLPEDVVRLAKARGIEPEELAKAAETLLLLEAISMDSKLEMEDALKLAKEVSRKTWARLREATQQ